MELQQLRTPYLVDIRVLAARLQESSYYRLVQSFNTLAYGDMGIETDHLNNDSVWTGRYWLKDEDREGVPFSVWMTVKNGKLSGSTLEPNAFALIDQEELDASIRGHVADDEVVFLKTYKAFEHEPVYFEGELSEDGRTVVGKWYFGWPNEWSGPFEMTRGATDTNIPAVKTSRSDIAD